MSANGNGGLAGKVLTLVLAVFLAFVIWFVVSAPRRERMSERTFAAPLSLIGMPRDLVITSPMPETVSVRLRGRVSNLRSLSSQNLEVTVDLSWAQSGEAKFTIRPQAINVPDEVEVVSIEPANVRFRVEQLRQKTVPIRPFLVGTPPAGYAVGEPAIVPDSVLVSGPISQLRNLSEVATERIIMTGRTDTFTTSVAVVSDSPLVRIVDPLAAQVTVPVIAEIGPVPPSPAGTDAASGDDSTPQKTEKKARKP